MRLIEWAFKQEIPTAEKLVLVYLATEANAAGVGPMDRAALSVATGYKKRSIQRLLKSLRDSQHLVEHGIWYGIGNLGLGKIVNDEELAQLPDEQQFDIEASRDGLQINVDAEAIGEAVAKHVIDAAEYHLDQLRNFETRLAEQMKRLALFHMEHKPELPLPDPVLTNLLYQQLLDYGIGAQRAYALSKADLDMGDAAEEPAPAEASDEADSYPDNHFGRYCRILDILHGAEAENHDSLELRRNWEIIEEQENKHTVKGETDAFLLVYPAIIAAAKANVGKLSISEFCDPIRAAKMQAPWYRELNPADKDAPELMAEIAVMLSEIADANDPRCEVQPRTKETGDDGTERTETVLGYHRRVSAKHRDMQRLKAMGVI